MRGFDRMKQESVKRQGFSAPSAGLLEPWTTPCADVAALCKSARRKMRSQMQFAKRFAKQGKAKKQINRSTLMSMKNKVTALAFVAFAATAASTAAQAQLALDNGAFVSTSGSQTTGSGITSLDLGNAGAYTNQTLITKMPMSLTFGSVTANISFTGSSAMFDGGIWAPSANNWLNASPGGSVQLSFSSTQQYFGTRWMSVDTTNQFSFYNGDQLVASVTGAEALPGLANGTRSIYADFNFAEAGYDRVLVSAVSGSLEFGEITFSENIQAAPIPLNAASLGGLMSFLMMIFMRGKGGTQVAIRMAFASIMPTRRVLA